MQFSIFFVALIAALSQSTIAASVSSDAAECGALGVMEVPEGVSPSDVRKCADHPTEINKTNGTSPARADGKLEALLACQTGAPYGCSAGGYCWKICGAGGEWCWTAAGGGSGDWRTCNTFKDCGTGDDFACGKGCAACGCSC